MISRLSGIRRWLNRGFEARECSRFQIPDASILWSTTRLADTQSYTGERFPLYDISRGGLRFLCMEKLKKGTKIYIYITIPDLNEELALSGTVRWIGPNPNNSYTFQVGVQFLPYGHSKSLNPPQYLEKIKQLERIYVQS